MLAQLFSPVVIESYKRNTTRVKSILGSVGKGNKFKHFYAQRKSLTSAKRYNSLIFQTKPFLVGGRSDNVLMFAESTLNVCNQITKPFFFGVVFWFSSSPDSSFSAFSFLLTEAFKKKKKKKIEKQTFSENNKASRS